MLKRPFGGLPPLAQSGSVPVEGGSAMRMTDPVAILLAEKGGQLFSLSPKSSVYDAIDLMSQRQIGAVLILEGDHLVGVLSERDYARRVILQGRSSRETRIEEIMTFAPLITASPEFSLEECMRLMTNHHVRHLPIVDHDRVAGIVSIGDLVKRLISAQAETIQHMEGYFYGNYPA
jgi:CBS domain-containing protein